MTVFDLLDAPLEGSNLIEASAGTGKTHNIVGLFVRLVVEKQLAPRNILVVTYTIAATEELRGRIRRRLVETEGALLTGETQDPFIAGLTRKIQQSGRTEVARRLLRAAIRNFDEAAIYTIHSFCYRMLQEHAFESGALFETELIPDEDAIKREFAQDFWRRHFYEAPAEFVAYSLEKNLGPDYYLDILKQAYPNPTVALIPETPPPNPLQMEAEIQLFHNLFSRLQDLWEKDKHAIAELLHQPGLNGRLYGKKVDPLLDSLKEFFLEKRPLFPLPAGLEKITAKKIGENVNKGHMPPAHPLFDLADRLWTQSELLTSCFGEYLRYLRMEIVRHGRMELPRRKERRNVLAYDDLLNDLYGALRTERGQRLAGEIRSRFQAVLIDEFQDTDPVQYAIFKSLFLAEEKVEDRPFFVIGDPKQAIYAFRGADIFAYIDAARAMQRTYTLKENWRSEPELLQAVNTLFGTPQRPFLYDEIHYRPVTAADLPDRDLFFIDNQREPPFQWWLIPEETEDSANEAAPPGVLPVKGLAKTGLYTQVAASVASEVARLIRLGVEGRARIGDKALQAEDMAILVRTNREAEIMGEALVRWNIPHVVSSRESVFHSAEAKDLKRILSALADPRNPSLVRAALLTDIMGMTGDDLHALATDEAGWEEILRRFHLYHALWTNRGFIRMFRSFLENEHLPSRILKVVGGERRLTNLLHIGELLHQAATTDHLAMHDLIKWLTDQIGADETQPEAYELRLEREEKAVKVVTIHKSKGLEYPIVFCPFCWGGGGPGKSRDHVLYHDPAQSFAPVLDFGSPDFEDHRLRAEEESLAEDIRLLYVALTRARHRTYYVWGRMQHAEHSASAYLFHQGPEMTSIDPACAVRERYGRLTGEDFRRDVETIASASGHTIRIEPLPAAQEKPYRLAPPSEKLACRQFTGKIDSTWKVASYTQLVAGNYGDWDRDDDEHAPQREMKPAPEEDLRERIPGTTGTLDMFGFPGGTKAGIFLHDILEKIDYRGADPPAAQDLVLEKLDQYSYDSQWVPAIMTMVEKVTNTPFPLFPGGRSDLTLSQIRPEDRRNEVEFYFPLRRLSRDDLARVFRKGAAMSSSGLSKAPRLHCLERLQFSPLQGYLKGFIDLLFYFDGRFYLLDWKSNHLGKKRQDYGQDKLLKVMDEGYYFIQYHLYALALHQYLAFRIPNYCYEDHFGGIYYCFLRGMDPAGGSAAGVFHDRPPLELLEMMKEVLIRPPGV